MRPMTAEDLWSLARVGLPAPSPDGSFAVVGVKTADLEKNNATEQLWRIDGGGRPAERLTHAESSSSEPAVSPDGRMLAFTRKPAGGAHPQLWVMPLTQGGEPRKLTDLPLGAGDPRWFPDGRTVGVLAAVLRDGPSVERTRELLEQRAKDPVKVHVTEHRIYRFWDRWLTAGEVHHVFAVDVETGATRDLTPTSTAWFDLMDPSGQWDISPDGREIAFSADISRPPHADLRAAIFVAPVDGSSPPVCLTEKEPAGAERPRYSPDGSALVWGQRRDPTFYADRLRLVRFDRDARTVVSLTEDWDRSPADWQFAGARTLVIEAEDRGRVALFAMEIDAPGVPRLLTREGSSHGPRPSADGRIWVQHPTLSRPPEIARVPLAGGAPEKTSGFNDAHLAELSFGKVHEITVESASGEPVQTLIVTPPGWTPEAGRAPLVHLVHGGPYGMNADGWHWRWCPQIFAGKGWIVALVNFHGSSGHGQAFAESILGRWGAEAADDVLRATDAVVARGWADEKKMAVTGGSFGGYMTLWTISQTDRFRCAVAHAAVFDLAGLWAADVTQGLDREVGGPPWDPEGAERLAQHDPARFAGRINTPLLIIHGEKDVRVPVSHAHHVYGILKSRGKDARLVIYPDENHWILSPRSSLHWHGEFLSWLDRHIGQPS